MSGTYLPVPTTRTPISDRHFGLDEGRSLLIGSKSAQWVAGSRATAVEWDYTNEECGVPSVGGKPSGVSVDAPAQLFLATDGLCRPGC